LLPSSIRANYTGDHVANPPANPTNSAVFGGENNLIQGAGQPNPVIHRGTLIREDSGAPLAAYSMQHAQPIPAHLVAIRGQDHVGVNDTTAPAPEPEENSRGTPDTAPSVKSSCFTA
jgi:hypothetical protein